MSRLIICYYINIRYLNTAMWFYSKVLCFIVLYQYGKSLELDCGWVKQYTECKCNEVSSTVVCHGSKVYNNNTAVLADMPSEVQNLTIVGFNSSRISKISSCSLPMQLKFLDLSNNNIQRLDKTSFRCMPNLEILTLAHNVINLYAPTEIFQNSLSKVRVLDLESAFIGWLNCSTETLGNCNDSLSVKLDWYINGIGTLTSLQEVNLASNRIWSIPGDIQAEIGNLTSLRLLNFSGNSLTFPEMDKGLLHLEELDLSNNWIPYLKDKFLRDLKRMSKLKRLYLQDNLYKCDCEMKNFITWLQNRTQSSFVQERESLVCFEGFGKVSSGDKLINITVSDLSCPQYDFPKTPLTIIIVGLLIGLVVSAIVGVLILNRASVKRCLCNRSPSDREYLSVNA